MISSSTKNSDLRAFHVLLDSIRSAILVFGPEKGILACSRNFCELLGYERRELLGLRLSSIFQDEGLGTEVISRLVSDLSSQGLTDGTFKLMRKTGEAIRLGYKASSLDIGSAGKRSVVLVVEERQANGQGGDPIQNLARLYDENPSPVLRLSKDGLILYANRASWLMLAHWNTNVGDRVQPFWSEVAREAIVSRQSREEELRIGFKAYHLVFVPVVDTDYVNIFGLDITARKQVERKLLLDAQVFENASEAIIIADPELRILDVNLAFASITGFSREEVLGEEVSILKSDKHDKGFHSAIFRSVQEQGSWQGELWERRKSGDIFPAWLSISSMHDESGALSRYVGLFSDISALKHSQEQLHYMAHYDSLTGLANRRHFLDRLELGISDSKRTKERMAVLCIDLDDFKQVNDSYGHHVGDQLLWQVAGRIRTSLRQGDTIARVGGDEFSAILLHITDAQDAAVAAQKLLKRVCVPVMLDEREIMISASIGIAIFPTDAADQEALMACADGALHRAKELGKNCHQFFSPELNKRAQESVFMRAKMRRGIDMNEFLLFYQPQIDVGTGLLSGVEALARWKSHELGMVGPDRFIPVAEETGMILEIGEQLLIMACSQAKIWNDKGLKELKIAVNVSAVQLKRSDFAGMVKSIIEEYGMPSGGLEMEITESVLLEEDDDQVIMQLHRLKSLGMTLAIDDFGIKYSSLAYLKRLPIDRLKIDRAFVKDLATDRGSLAIASAIIAMSHSLDLQVIAEGVETEGQAKALAEKGCDYFQGMFFSEPLPAERIDAFWQGGIVSLWPGIAGS